jgi:hypothetical protein
VAHDDLAVQPQPRVQETRLPVAVRRLVQVHEIHVDRRPRQIAVKLRVQVHEGFPQRRQSADPHFRRGKRVHPQHEAGARRVVIRVEAEGADFVGRLEHRLEDQLQRDALRAAEAGHDGLGIARHLRERFRTVKVLAAGHEPDFGMRSEDHGKNAGCKK